ncbi:MAG: hypothetical protein DCC43_07255 [Candidatus Brocadia sp.]|jgi:hypothetical protein|uniref:Uncharacterized protein n=1 Tax=Candidatus Brocadia fulgida TaxID=380242 RepID=A0A0M2UYX0_9BACT|nr:MAG: hypothetical protein BROFUL_00266 [Candidatus Brocadia fulgida]MCC6326826.1 hypothetical protein [Candidatus Brocadia sp.]MCE7912111.1 hypothetical protein [Candidatus Brocadia sp. AMX3]OQY98554.1 MAG: hypothetical protein B6D35_11680 [Candidatus Brocadia sp. UTAMX2]MBV6518460.1 hypothetical protein [Candidatus Brocadia fulgida]
MKGFCYSFAVVSALMFGAGVVNAAFVGSAMAEEKNCDKCGHVPAKAENDCKCDCHNAKH